MIASTHRVACCRSTSATTSPTKTRSTRFDSTASGSSCGTTRMATARSAAHFTLKSPDQVREFLQRGYEWLAYTHQTSAEAWDFTFEGYDPHSEKLREALCTVGNGYFATRGAAPESKAGQVHYPGTYAAGVYNRLDDDVSGSTNRQREPGEPAQLASADVPCRRRQLVRHRRSHAVLLPADSRPSRCDADAGRFASATRPAAPVR